MVKMPLNGLEHRPRLHVVTARGLTRPVDSDCHSLFSKVRQVVVTKLLPGDLNGFKAPIRRDVVDDAFDPGSG
jgi:hypothetical protein